MLYPTEEVFHPPHFCLSLSLALSTPAGLNESAQLINGSAKRATWTIKFQSYAWFIVRLFCNTA